MAEIDIDNLPDDVESLRAMIVANQLEYKQALLAAELKQQEQSIALA